MWAKLDLNKDAEEDKDNEEDGFPFPIVDIEGKVDIEGNTRIVCKKCGEKIEIPPRTQEEIDRIRGKGLMDVIPKTEGIAHPRIVTCPKCDSIIFCKDQFTKT